jgi:hypothetical protein
MKLNHETPEPLEIRIWVAVFRYFIKHSEHDTQNYLHIT